MLESPWSTGDSVISNASGGTGQTKARVPSNPILQIVALVAMFALLSFFALSHGSSETSLGHDLQSHGVRTVGTVTFAEPSNHDQLGVVQ
jgi:hypothetical protein